MRNWFSERKTLKKNVKPFGMDQILSVIVPLSMPHGQKLERNWTKGGIIFGRCNPDETHTSHGRNPAASF